MIRYHLFPYIQYKSLQYRELKYTTYNLLYYTTRTVYQEEQDNITTPWTNINLNTKTIDIQLQSTANVQQSLTIKLLSRFHIGRHAKNG